MMAEDDPCSLRINNEEVQRTGGLTNAHLRKRNPLAFRRLQGEAFDVGTLIGVVDIIFPLVPVEVLGDFTTHPINELSSSRDFAFVLPQRKDKF
jgi:hypothetical protein